MLMHYHQRKHSHQPIWKSRIQVHRVSRVLSYDTEGAQLSHESADRTTGKANDSLKHISDPVRFPLHSLQVSEGFQSDNRGGHLRRCKIENGDCSILISLRGVFNVAT